MATLEKRGRSFRIIFRHAGVRYARSLTTRDDRAAQATLSRLEDNLHRLSLGTLEVPPETDLVAFLLSDGRAKSKPVAPPPQAQVLAREEVCWTSQVQTNKMTCHERNIRSLAS